MFKTDLEALSDDLREDKSLVQFQMFLNDAGHRADLDFSFWGIGPTTGLRLHCGKGEMTTSTSGIAWTYTTPCRTFVVRLGQRWGKG